jgi:hypothetical protein
VSSQYRGRGETCPLCTGGRGCCAASALAPPRRSESADGVLLLSTEGVYSRDMGRGNSREGGGAALRRKGLRRGLCAARRDGGDVSTLTCPR